jgi:hypothetical protein
LVTHTTFANVDFIIISLLQSTVGHRPLQLVAISLDLRLLASSSSQPSCAIRHSTWPEGVLHYVYQDVVSTLEPHPNGSSTTDMASPLPLQHANTVCYVGDFSSLLDHLVSDSIMQRNPEHSSFHECCFTWLLSIARQVSLPRPLS